ncbi:lactoylglutathione lyase [Enterococcus saigonensis]|uniref:Lactoylglutathione lyase n=1 Tax=Enterococcus saigonensis TaxID=1805431 RepID=A0A679IK92_9ENTE|nr:VOC family protein [Enterococcus saigonensis]BCA85965.1 lactoylglutathione lyase [Enterococcus saigonensis]
MFTEDIQIMLYVDDVKKAVTFWQALDFVIIEEQEVDGTSVVELAITTNAKAHFVLYDRNFIESNSPEVATNSPSLMFFSQDIFTLYKKVGELNVPRGEMISLGDREVFNFADPDGNYFAVSSMA